MHIRILLVEDNPGDARLIKEMINDTEYASSELVWVETIADAIAESKRGNSYTLILLDLSLPDSTGVNSIKSIRLHFPESTLIILTGFNDEQTAIFALREGAQNYLVKGEFDTVTLSRTIHFSQERHKLILSLHHSEANLRSIFDNTNVGYILTDNDFRVKSYNNLAVQWATEALGEELTTATDLWQLFTRNNKLDSDVLLNPPLSGLGVSVEVKLEGTAGNRWYEINAFPVRNQLTQVLGISIAIQDINTRKRNELEQENILTELVKKNNDLEQFSYIISHNLRAPVANIIALSDLIHHKEMTEQDKTTIINGLKESAQKMDTVVVDLSQILQIRKGVSELKELVQFSSLVHDITAVLSAPIEEHSVEINTDFSGVNDMVTIKSYLHSIFYNLVANSIKYRKPEVSPVVTIHSRLLDNSVELTFSDNGLGIDMEKYGDKVFGLYKRFHSSSEGRGIGLYMTRTQVGLLGGNISVKSSPGKGAIFTITLPL